MPQTMPHIPLYASAQFKGKSERGLYGDVIEELDWSMGQVLQTLEQLDITENTLVIFTSDNGPWDLKNGHGGSAFPLRGHKFTTYEGGMRVPMIAQWKGKIPADAVCEQLASTIDILPTIAFLTDSEMPKEKIDGENIWPLLAGKSKKSPHKKEGFYYYSGTTAEAIRKGDWKLRRRNDEVELYNLAADISESSNVATSNPKIVKKLTGMLEDFDAALKADSLRYQ
jgi:arylsulfatase A-like enzyme